MASCLIIQTIFQDPLHIEWTNGKTIEAMPITCDIRTDFLYKKGKEEGREEGLEPLEQKERAFITRGDRIWALRLMK